MSEAVVLQRDPSVSASGDPRTPSSGDVVFSPSLVMISHPLDSQAEAIRGLRTHIMARHVQEGRRALAVCAASEDVGCTFIAANLAVALSQVGVNTLIIDADLRQPRLDTLIPPRNPGSGLRHWLGSPEVNFSRVIETDVLPNLSVMHSGGPVPNPQELLANDRFRALMDYCLREFDATIVDTPPANTCSDALRIANVVGYCLIVSRRDKSFIDDVKTLGKQLEANHARIVGTVLNEA